MFKIYEYDTDNKDDVNFHQNERPKLEIIVFQNGIRISRFERISTDQHWVYNYSPNTKDYNLWYTQEDNPYEKSKTPYQPRLVFSNKTVKIDVSCSYVSKPGKSSSNVIHIQILPFYQSFDKLLPLVYDEEKHIFMAYDMRISAPEFIKELYNTLLLTY